MKTSLFTVVLAAVASSLVTAGTIELLRGPRAGPPALAGGSPTPVDTAPAPFEPPAPAVRDVHLLPPDEDRLLELEQRIAALERRPASERAPATSPTEERPSKEELRDLVLAWVAEERETRGRAAALEEEARARKEREFGARFTAHMMAQEHDLAEWQQQKLVELFLEIEERRQEIEKSIDVGNDDPKEVEERWVEFDEWAESREREVTAQVDARMYESLYGDG